jgi:hypothetical protein
MEAANHAMDLFERYLQAVRKYLPAARQDDIVAELRANLEAQREERESALGRPLSEGEMIDWLKELGPPLQMAARYQAPRYLIGPAIFPLYWQILRLVLLWASVVYVATSIIQAIAQAHDTAWIFGVVFNWPTFLLIVAAWVTIIFVAIQFFSERHPEKAPDFLARAPHWSPTSLPPLEKHPAPAGKPRTYTAAVAEFVVEFAVLLWLLLIPHYPFLILGPGVVILHNFPLRFAPAVVWFYWAIVIFNVIQLAWHGFDLLYDRWRIRGPVQKLFIKAFGLIPIAILFAAPGHIYLEPYLAGSGHLPPGFSLFNVNHGLYIGVAIILAITVAQLLWDLWHFTSRTRRQPTAVVL